MMEILLITQRGILRMKKMYKKAAANPFYMRMFQMALPIILQNLLSAAVGSADVVMLNYVGQSSIAAVSLASQYTNVLFMVYYGLGTGVTMLSAQYYGKKDLRAVQTVEGLSLIHISEPTRP